MLKIVFFDLDGVIVKLEKIHYLAWKSVFSWRGINFNEKTWNEVFDKSRQEIVAYVNDKFKLDLTNDELKKISDDKVVIFKKIIADNQCSSWICEGIIKAIEEVKQKNILVGVISHSQNCEFILKKLNIIKYFDYYTKPMNKDSDSTISTKIFTIQSPIKKALNELKISGSESIAFDDTEKGINEFNEVGSFSVMIDYYKKNTAPNAKLRYHFTNEININEVIFRYYLVNNDENDN